MKITTWNHSKAYTDGELFRCSQLGAPENPAENVLSRVNYSRAEKDVSRVLSCGLTDPFGTDRSLAPASATARPSPANAS